MTQSIYKNPIFLNSLIHKSVRVMPVSNYKFAGKLNSVLLLGQEFLEAAKFFPVVFTKGEDGTTTSAAILGLRDSENLFVSRNGRWKEGVYVPAYLRRYPFILASNVGPEGSYAVCADSGYEGFGNSDGMLLFDDNGHQTPEFSKTVEFLRNFQTQHENTQRLVKVLEELNLLKEVSANITMPTGGKIGLRGLLMVDEEVMLTLDDARVGQLFRSGYLAWIYAHLYSMSNFRALIALAENVKKAAAT